MATDKKHHEPEWTVSINWHGYGETFDDPNPTPKPYSVLSGQTHHFVSIKAPHFSGDESDIRLRFDLKPFSAFSGTCNGDIIGDIEGLSLWAKLIKGKELENLIVSIEASLTITDASKPPAGKIEKDIEKLTRVLIFNPETGEHSHSRCVDKKFAILYQSSADNASTHGAPPSRLYSPYPTSYNMNHYAPPKPNPEILIAIILKAKVIHVARPSTKLSSLALQDFKNMYSSADNNYPDIKLKSKDNMLISTHKFILAARSSYFRQLLKKTTEESPDTKELAIDHNAKPLLVILHWMYTDEIAENVDRFVEEVLEAAKCFQLENLIKALDGEMIKFCNKNNMFQLIMQAKKHSMTVACKAISKFIKQNVDSFVEDA